jgi:kynurenine formamidase
MQFGDEFSHKGGPGLGSEEGGGMRLVDLSRPLENTVAADPPGLGPRIEYSDHKQSLSGMLAMFPGLEASQLPGGEAWAIERLMVTTHNGTHVDAPWHFASTMNGGERAWTIDEVAA